MAEKVENILPQVKKSGWKIFCLDVTPGRYQSYLSLEKVKVDPSKAIFVLGSEGAGVSEEMAKVADAGVSVRPGKGCLEEFPETLVDSLNVSVTASILLAHLASLAKNN